jgi:hypothetical protein
MMASAARSPHRVILCERSLDSGDQLRALFRRADAPARERTILLQVRKHAGGVLMEVQEWIGFPVEHAALLFD